MSSDYTGNGVGPTGGAVSTGAISTSTYQDDSTTTTSTPTTTTVGGSDYAAQSSIGPNASGDTINSTTTDFGAIDSAEAIATTAIQQNSQIAQLGLQGQEELTQLTGQALLAKSTPLSQTLAKSSTIIVGIIATAVVLAMAVWYFSFHREPKGAKA
jgi:hypothetical protein